MFCDRIWLNAHLATLRTDRAGIGEVPDGIIACRDMRIVYAGAAAEAPPGLDAPERIDCAGRWITPGLIDCHTHLIHAGDRSHEFELRLRGASYEEIARAGGGILSTMRATRAASEEALVDIGPSAVGRPDRRRCDHDRSEVGLRPRPRHRAKAIARRPCPGRTAPDHDRDRLSWAPTPSHPKPPARTRTSIWSVPR